jgi:hypothetical protein
MKHLLVYILMFAFFTSCIPLSFAPNIKTDKAKLAKRFKRDLPKQHGFIFEDPKEADEFYTFINTKYQLPGINRKIPLWIDSKPYIMNVYERRRTTRTLNFIPILIDAALSDEDRGVPGFFNSFYTTRNEKWFIIITLTDLNGQDALMPNHEKRNANLVFLRSLQKEYLNTANYMEAYFRLND